MTSRADLRQITHDKVTATAERLFREHGFKATTVRDIAAGADVSVGSVMAIGDKRALLVSMFDRTIGAIHQDRSGSDAHIPAKGDSVDQIMELVSPFFSVFAANVDLAREYGAVLMTGDHNSIVFQELGDVLVHEVESILRADGMDEADVPTAARTIYIAYLGTIFAWAGSGSTDATTPFEAFRSIVSFTTQPKDH